MSPRRPGLPGFKHPPVVEVVLGVSFKPLEALRLPQFGALCEEFTNEGFSNVQEQPIYVPPVEAFGPAAIAVNLSIEIGPTLPRVWLLSQDEQRLVQLQRNWLAFNWRKVGVEAEYKRWDSVRTGFAGAYGKVETFLKKRNLGSLAPIQCEVSYINQIDFKALGLELGDVASVIRLVGRVEVADLPGPEQISLQTQYVIPGLSTPLGRMHVSVQPGVRREDGAPVLAMTLTARGRPAGDGATGVLEFMDRGSEFIVQAFHDLTSEQMHQTWVKEE